MTIANAQQMQYIVNYQTSEIRRITLVPTIFNQKYAENLDNVRGQM